jgi:asparaginyl-tRNA synthetase
MLEAEMNFMNLDQLMIFMEDMVKHFASELLKNKKDEIAYLDSLNNGLIDKLENLVNNEFAKKSYREAIEILKEARDSKKVTFQNNDIDFGTDLDSEHERYLCEKHFQKPTFIYNYPTAIKAFYMKRNNDETVKGVDLLVPLIGELCGGSERENNHNNLMENMKDKNIPLEELS